MGFSIRILLRIASDFFNTIRLCRPLGRASNRILYLSHCLAQPDALGYVVRSRPKWYLDSGVANGLFAPHIGR